MRYFAAAAAFAKSPALTKLIFASEMCLTSAALIAPDTSWPPRRSILLAVRQTPVEPGFRQRPLTLDGGR